MGYGLYIAIDKHHYKPWLTKNGKRDQKILLTINKHEMSNKLSL
jgi:hypothetical protein